MTTLSYDRGEAEPALLTATIGAQLEMTADRFGERTALVDVPSGRRWTYAELLADSRAFAAGLLRNGIRRGDRVGVWAPNTPEWVIVQFGTALAGVILVNLNPSYRQRELEYALNQSGIVAVYTMTSFKTSEYAAMLQAARSEAPELRDVVTFGSAEWDAYLVPATDDELGVLADLGDELTADDPINIQYTSGTTGFPKGATLTHSNILNNGYLVGELLNYSEQDSICIPVPLLPLLRHGDGQPRGHHPRCGHGDSRTRLRAGRGAGRRRRREVHQPLGVPTMFIAELALANFDSYDLSSLRTGVMAGSPCPEEIMRKVVDRMGMTEVSICYGMTETSPVSTQTRVDDALELRVSTVGRVGPHLEIQVIDPIDGTVMPRGEVGELCTRGYSVMKGYWNNEEKTAEAIDADGWMHTGDLATMDDAGYVRVTGRIKDMVIRGGENIYPREIEEFLYTHPDILDAQVIGVPDERYGEELMAWIQLREGVATFTVEDLKVFADGKIARHKIPRYVHVVSAFPMTVSGKIRKVQMREESIGLLGLGE
ncbi:AMP-binding protein [Tsukamurella spumae]|uniref:AMP-binding protein n=1 Tax=Tsukamurella spumae TaxID=44753 RepID=UPI001FE5046E|nr:AMP-binding protein [Tsukamurella spumae]